MSLHRQTMIVRRRFFLIIDIVVVITIAAYLIASAQPRAYEASSTLIVGQALSGANPDMDGLQTSQYLSRTYASLAESEPLLDKVAAKLGLQESAQALLGRVQAAAAEGDAMVIITAQDGDPAAAAALADAVAAEVVAAAPTAQGREAALRANVDADLADLRDEITRTQVAIDDLTAADDPENEAEVAALREQQLALRAAYTELLGYSLDGATNQVAVLKPAVIPTTAIAPRPLYYTLAGAALGLMLGLALAFLLDFRDDRVRDIEDIEEATDLPVIVSVPAKRAGPRRDPDVLKDWVKPSSVSDAYRSLRASLELSYDGSRLATIVVASPLAGDRRTSTAANLAIAFAQSGRSVLLVDADRRSPSLHAVFGLANDVGYSDLLEFDMATSGDLVQFTQIPNLRLLTAGRHSTASVSLGSSRARSVVQRLSAPDELTIFDTTPMSQSPDAAMLSTQADATLLVVHAGRTTGESVRDTETMLALAHATVPGVVVHGLRARTRHTRLTGRPPKITSMPDSGSNAA